MLVRALTRASTSSTRSPTSRDGSPGFGSCSADVARGLPVAPGYRDPQLAGDRGESIAVSLSDRNPFDAIALLALGLDGPGQKRLVVAGQRAKGGDLRDVVVHLLLKVRERHEPIDVDADHECARVRSRPASPRA